MLLFLPHYLPGYKIGGPLQSIVNLVDALGDEFRFRIITSDRDFGDTAPYGNVPIRRWTAVGKAEVIYLAPEDLSLRSLARLMRETTHEAVYLNSFFHPRFTTLPLLAMRLGLAPRRPTILAPRGEFSEGALSIKSGKKRAFIAVGSALGLYRKVKWQASTAYERADVLRVFPGGEVWTAKNLPRRETASSSRQVRVRAPGAPLRAVFLSRISPKKNLLYALKVLREVRVPVRFTIYGPREDVIYWRQCEATIATLPRHVEVVVAEGVHPTKVVQTLAAHDLFFFPTRGENYGHVIVEALSAGLRLLLSDQTPWRGLAAAGVGHDLPLDDPKAFARAIEFEAELDANPERIAIYLETTLSDAETLEDNRRLLRAARHGQVSRTRREG